MNNDNKYITHDGQSGPLPNDFFSKSEIPFEKSKENVWDMIDSKLDKMEDTKIIRINFRKYIHRYVAVFLLLIGITGFFRFYSKTISCPRGEHITATLPDNSEVRLNAESTLKYYPLWWPISRGVEFEGEGFFKVQKGSQFRIRSVSGKTIVLGTSFNIYSRNENYQVTCLTGKVRVVSKTREKVVLLPNDYGEIVKKGKIRVRKNYNTKESTAWLNNMFIFTASPINDVFREIERQYDVSIYTKNHLEFKYTGYFSKEKSTEDVLSLICRPLGLHYEKQANEAYLISKIN